MLLDIISIGPVGQAYDIVGNPHDIASTKTKPKLSEIEVITRKDD